MKGKKILLVDDEVNLLKLMAHALENAGYVVITAASGEEAIEVAKREVPHLILLDIRMPGMDGTQVGEILKKTPVTKDIPIIFLTGLLSKSEEKDLNRKLVGHLFLAKPCDKNVLLEEIAKRL